VARKRMIDPSFWIDEKVGELAFVERLIFIGLWTFADDNGVGRANPKQLKAAILPYDDTFRVSDFEKSLAKIATLKLITLYEIDGQKYYFVNNFKRHQTINKPTPSNLPLPLPEKCSSPTAPLQPKRREENLSEENRSEENAHTREKSQKHFFDTHDKIQFDNYDGLITEIDFDLLGKCYDESSWLQENITNFSWLCKYYKKIAAGEYKDFKKSGKPPKRYSGGVTRDL